MATPPRSEAQRAASRANGRKSRGPRSPGGKGRSRRNALKHGLRAASLEIVANAAGTPVTSLAAAVRDRLAPADVIEGELVEGIALALWRLRRAHDLEEALAHGRPDAAGGNPLLRLLLRRGNAADALALLLRYRNQALGEAVRLRQLLEQHRRPAASPGAALESPAGHEPTASARARRPANDNRRDDDPPGGPPSTGAGERGDAS